VTPSNIDMLCVWGHRPSGGGGGGGGVSAGRQNSASVKWPIAFWFFGIFTKSLLYAQVRSGIK
jgi:hypothetical protein